MAMINVTSDIVTLTFNAAIDKNSKVDLLLTDEKLNCSVPVYEAGGGGINVTRAIKQLGGNAIAMYMAGGNSGTKLGEIMHNESINSIVTITKSETRENLNIVENSTNRQYRFVMLLIRNAKPF